MVSTWDEYVPRLQAAGFRWVELKMDRRSLNPFRELLVVARLAALYRRERPSAVHHFTAKCVLYGSLAAKWGGVPHVVNALTGLGHLFNGQDRKTRLLRLIVKACYQKVLTEPRVRVVFQNPDDLRVFTESNLVIPERTVLIRSSGVDLERFRPRPCGLESGKPIVLFAARLTREKGLEDFIEAVRILQSRHVGARFQVAGSQDFGSPSCVSSPQLERWREAGVVELLGHVDRMEDVLAPAALVVLPSRGGEGVPRVLLEASAMSKPIVTTDVPGCREAVIHGCNGLQVAARRPQALAEAIETLLRDPTLREQMGHRGRLKMIEEFDDREVARRTVDVYETMGVLREEPRREQSWLPRAA